MDIKELGHVVLYVRDLARSRTDVPGMDWKNEPSLLMVRPRRIQL